MSHTQPPAGDPFRAPSGPAPASAPAQSAAAPTPYAGPHPAWTGGPVPSPGPGPSPAQPPAKPGPSWVAWLALALSALAFVVATTVGILYAVHSVGPDRPSSASGEEFFYDAGLPAWGSVDLTPTGAVTDRALTDAVDVAYGDSDDGIAMQDLLCEALPAPRKDTVTTCSATVDDLESTIVVFFTDDRGTFLATLY